mgnify:CR=1 FL=1
MDCLCIHVDIFVFGGMKSFGRETFMIFEGKEDDGEKVPLVGRRKFEKE